MKEVLNIGWDLRSKYYNIGLELGILPGTLDTIKMDNPSNCEDCYRDVVLKWLRGSGKKPKTKEVFEKALNSALVASKYTDLFQHGITFGMNMPYIPDRS